MVIGPLLHCVWAARQGLAICSWKANVFHVSAAIRIPVRGLGRPVVHRHHGGLWSGIPARLSRRSRFAGGPQTERPLSGVWRHWAQSGDRDPRFTGQRLSGTRDRGLYQASAGASAGQTRKLSVRQWYRISDKWNRAKGWDHAASLVVAGPSRWRHGSRPYHADQCGSARRRPPHLFRCRHPQGACQRHIPPCTDQGATQSLAVSAWRSCRVRGGAGHADRHRSSCW